MKKIRIEIDDFVFYHLNGLDNSAPLIGKVIGIYDDITNEIRTDSDGMQVAIAISLHSDWVWEDGKYVRPRS